MSKKTKYTPPENHYIILDIAFATAYGVNEALLFGKLYRLQIEFDGKTDDEGHKWVRLTYEEWERELPFLSRNTIIRTIERLENEKIFLSTIFGGRSKWYRCNPEYISNHLSTQNEKIHLPKMGKSSTQNEQLPKSFPKSLPKKTTTDGDFDENLQKVSVLYENEIGLLSPIIADQIKDCLEHYPVEWIVDAIMVAAKQNVRRWSYVEGVLRKRMSGGRVTPDAKKEREPPQEREKIVNIVTGEWSGGYYNDKAN